MALTDSLIAFWELEESSGTRVDAHSTHDLSDNNTVTSNPGKVGTAGQFTAANTEYLNIASNSDLETGDISYMFQAWVYLDSKSAFQVILSKYGAAGNRDYFLAYTTATDRFRFRVVRSDSVAIEVDADVLGSPSTATWYCIHCWHDADFNEIGIAVNAGTENIQAMGGVPYAAGTYDFQLGYSDNLGFATDGRIDQVGFWKRVLTAAERTTLYNGGSGLSYAAMAGYRVALARF